MIVRDLHEKARTYLGHLKAVHDAHNASVSANELLANARKRLDLCKLDLQKHCAGSQRLQILAEGFLVTVTPDAVEHSGGVIYSDFELEIIKLGRTPKRST
jgi:hypothetical protein